MDATTALAIYRAEKDKALRERRVSHVQLMAEAQEAFRKMLADAQLARKGGRPKGSTNAVAAAPVVPPAPAPVVPAKLVLKTSKTPAKGTEKVTAIATPAAAGPVKAKKAVKADSGKAPARTLPKHPTPAKKAVVAKGRAVAKPARRAAAPAASKASSKKAKAPKQAAARERNATKARKH